MTSFGRVRLGGPEFVAGDYPPGAVEIVSLPTGPAVGQRLEIRAFQGDDLVASFEGRITHAAPGTIGGSIEATFCGGNLDVRLRIPHDINAANNAVPDFPAPGLDLRLRLRHGSTLDRRGRALDAQRAVLRYPPGVPDQR